MSTTIPTQSDLIAARDAERAAYAAAQVPSLDALVAARDAAQAEYAAVQESSDDTLRFSRARDLLHARDAVIAAEDAAFAA